MSDSLDGVAIRARGLTKIYPGPSAGAALRFMTRRMLRKEPVGPRALDRIDLEVRKGEALGIVGRNGSGKSTLLKILAGALHATQGEMLLEGRVGTLLDLGSGIHPEYSGEENALVLGMLAGLSKAEVRQRMATIRDFSGLGEAFDQPAKTYSSGMSLRLGFSAAIHCDPEVLLIDEALAVGDAFFQQRCLARMRRLREEGTTIVLVSHDPSAVISLCDRALWLEHGAVSADGRPAEVIRSYLAARYRDDCALDAPLEPVGAGAALGLVESVPIRPAAAIGEATDRFGDGRARVIGIEVRDDSGEAVRLVRPGASVHIVMTIESKDRIPSPLVGFTLRNRLGDIVTATNTELEGSQLPVLEPDSEVDVAFQFSWPSLSPGPFSISPAVAEGSIASHRMCDWVENVWILEAENARGLFGWMTLDDVRTTNGEVRTDVGEVAAVLVSDDARPTDDDMRVEFALEVPRTRVIEAGQVTDSRELFLSGWCFSVSGEPVRLTVQIGNAESRSVTAGGFRQDVGRVHSGVPVASRSGFGLLVPLPNEPGASLCRIQAELSATTRTLAEFELDLPDSIVIQDECDALPPRRERRDQARSRLLLVSHGLNLEGAPRSLLEMAIGLDADRFDKRLWSPASGPLEAVWEEAGIPTHRVDLDASLATRDDFDAQVRRMAGLASAIRPDVVIANTLETFWAVHMAVELGRPSIWIVRESESPEAYFHSRWPTPIAERALAALSLADRVVFVADATRELFEDRLEREKVRSIPNGLELSRFDPGTIPQSRMRIRRELKLADETPLLLCVGTPCMRKGQLELIRALGILRDTRPDFHCVFLGMVEGDYLTAMQEAIEELGLVGRVTLQMPVLDARPYFAAADVALCPSFQESLPRVVLEAMGFAKPILATRVFGIPELVRDEIDGILVEPGDVESIAKGIDRLLADPVLASGFGKSARRRAESVFSLERCVQGYTELLDEVLSGPGGASQ